MIFKITLFLLMVFSRMSRANDKYDVYDTHGNHYEIEDRGLRHVRFLYEFKAILGVFCIGFGEIYNARDFYNVTYEGCGEIGKVYAPCKVAQPTGPRFPACCPRIACPPYFTYLDAYVYTVSLVTSRGQAPLMYGTTIPTEINFRPIIRKERRNEIVPGPPVDERIVVCMNLSDANRICVGGSPSGTARHCFNDLVVLFSISMLLMTIFL